MHTEHHSNSQGWNGFASVSLWVGDIQVVKGVAWTLRGLNELVPPHVQVVPDGKDLSLFMEMGRGSRPYAAGGDA